MLVDFSKFGPWQVASAAAVLILLPVAFFLANLVIRVSKYYLKYRMNLSRYEKMPKHPRGHISFEMMDFHRDVGEDVKKFIKDPSSGEIYDLLCIGPDIVGDQTVIINDADLAGQVLGNPDVWKFPKAPFYSIVADALLGDGLVTSNGEIWKSHRTLLTPLFHFKSLKSMIDMMILYTEDLIKELEQNGASEYHLLHEVLSKYTLSQIVYLAFGGAMDIDWLHKRQIAIGDLYTKYVGLSLFFGPLVRYVPFTPAWKLFKCRREVEDMMRSIIRQAKTDLGSLKTKNAEDVNLISTMINAKDPATGRAITEDEIIEEACTFLFAGFDTTAVTLSWALYYLSKHPDVLRWVQEEIDSVLGHPKSARSPTIDDIPTFKRVRAVINETLRLRPPAWTVPRWTEKDVKIGQYDVPAKSIVEVNITIIHRNPKYWKNPDDFIPTRWTDEEETSRHPYAFVPFSAGARNCIGKNFAIQEMVIALSMILSHFTVELDPSRPMKPRSNPVPLPYCYVKFHNRKL